MAITKIQCLNEAHTGNPAAHLKNALSYIQNPEKTEENVLVGSINCLLDTAFEQIYIRMVIDLFIMIQNKAELLL